MKRLSTISYKKRCLNAVILISYFEENKSRALFLTNKSPPHKGLERAVCVDLIFSG
jgi:hypothetical protein